MKIETISINEFTKAGIMIREVFDEFIASDFNENSIIHFYGIIEYQSIKDRFERGNIISITKKKNDITGYIEMTNLNHIYLLFVKKEFQKTGIGRALVNSCIDKLKKSDPDMKKITVNSTFSAVKMYERLGFVKITDYQFKNGITSFPMSLDI